MVGKVALETGDIVDQCEECVKRSSRQGSSSPPTFSQTFDKAGSFEYFCAIHPTMKGQVEVTP
jgi:plastocyanin